MMRNVSSLIIACRPRNELPLASFVLLFLKTTIKLQQAKHNMFCLQPMKPLKVGATNMLMPQVNIRSDFLFLGEHCGADVVCVEDEHPPFLSPFRDDLAFFFDEATEMGELDLHSLVDDMCDMEVHHDVHQSPFLADMA